MSCSDGEIVKNRLSELRDTCFTCLANNKDEWMKKDEIGE